MRCKARDATISLIFTCCLLVAVAAAVAGPVQVNQMTLKAHSALLKKTTVKPKSSMVLKGVLKRGTLKKHGALLK